MHLSFSGPVEIIAFLVESIPQCFLERKTVTKGNSTTYSSVFQTALDCKAEPGVIALLLNKAREQAAKCESTRKLLVSPEIWDGCLMNVLNALESVIVGGDR